MKIECEWTGAWPCLCSGQWILFVDGVDMSDTIPFQGEPAGTFGEYASWHFDEDYLEVWDSYKSGRGCDEWCKEYAEWLGSIAPSEDWPIVFAAFSEYDWRHGECGGCI